MNTERKAVYVLMRNEIISDRRRERVQISIPLATVIMEPGLLDLVKILGGELGPEDEDYGLSYTVRFSYKKLAADPEQWKMVRDGNKFIFARKGGRFFDVVFFAKSHVPVHKYWIAATDNLSPSS